jgi:putative membrane protein
MSGKPYTKVDASELILRDHLAAERTVLANERTLLAYIRTALSLIITGVAFWKFVDDTSGRVVGLAFMPLGTAIMIFGLYRWRKTALAIRHIRGTPRT